MLAFAANPAVSVGALKSGAMDLARLAPYADDALILAARSGNVTGTTTTGAANAKHAKHKKKVDGQKIPDPTTLAPDVLEKMYADAEQAANAPQVAAGPNTVDKVLEKADKVANFGGFLPFIAMPLGAVGGGLTNFGNRIGFSPLSGLGKVLSAPSTFLAKPVEETFLAAPIKGLAQGTANVTAGLASGFAKTTGLDKRLHARHVRLSDGSFAKAQDLFTKVEAGTLPDALRSHVTTMQTAARGAGIAHTNIEQLEGAIKQAKEELSKVPRAERKPVKKAIAQLESAVYHHHGAASMQNIEQSIRSAPQKLGKMDLGHTIANGSFVAMSGISMASDARSFTKNLASLKQLYHDMTGQNASTMGVLFGKVPGIVAEARSHLITNTAIKETTDAAGVIVNLKGLLNPAFGGLKAAAAFMLPQFASMGADMAMGQSILPTYQTLKNSFDPKQQMPQEYYQAFLGTMSKELRKRGGADSSFTKAVAEEYANARATPEQMLKDIESGALTKKIEAIIATNKAASPQPTVSKEKQVLGKHTKQVISRENGAQQAAGHSVT